MNYKKRKRNKFIVLILSVIAVIAFAGMVVGVAFALEDNEGYRTIRVVETVGTVCVVKDGIEYKAYPGMHLQEGHELVVAGNSYARLVLDDDKYVKVESGSKVVFETLGLLGSGKTKINMQRGSMACELVAPLETGQEFVVNTPNAVLAVRGTFFHVNLSMTKPGEIVADVMTYGGCVATRRVLPSGEVVEEEVLVDSGYKTAIRMDAVETVYLVEAVEGAEDTTGDGNLDIEPIEIAEIPDDDLVDIYFAAEKGHELFVTAEEAKADIENRAINLEEKTSVYEMAGMEQALPFADDSMPLVMAENVEKITGEEVVAEGQNTQPIIQMAAVLTDGIGGEAVSVHTHSEVTNSEVPGCTKEGKTVVSCSICGEILSETVLPATGHQEQTTTVDATCVQDGSVTLSCSVCKEVLSRVTVNAYGHAMQTVVTNPTCTEDGYSVSTCSTCGYVTRQAGAVALGHTVLTEEVAASCTSAGYKKETCSVCGEILAENTIAGGHSSVTTRVEPTCLATGLETVKCSDCGEVLSETVLPIGGHTEVMEGTETIHSSCSVCGQILSTTHSYTDTITVEAACEAVGEEAHVCSCGYSYTTEIPATGHTYIAMVEEPTDSSDGRKYEYCEGCGDERYPEVLYGVNATNFPDAAFRNFVENNYNTDGEAGLCATEVNAVTSINIPSDVAAANLDGIEMFTQLTSLTVQSPTVQQINVSANTLLNNMTLTGATGLTTLNCATTAISSLDVSSNTALVTLNCRVTPITSLDLRGLTALTTVYMDACSSMTVVNASGCTSLSNLTMGGCLGIQTMNISYTRLATLDVSECTELNTLNISGSLLTELNVSNMGSLTQLDMENCPELFAVDASYCTSLTQADASGCPNLYTAHFIGDTSLKTVDVSYNSGMYELRVTDCTSLTSVDVTGCGNTTVAMTIWMGGTGKTSSFFTGYSNDTMMLQDA